MNDLLNQIRRNGTIVSALLTVALAAMFLLEWLAHFGSAALLAFRVGEGSSPFTAFTYPFASAGDGNALLNVIFSCLWLWQVGGQIESEIGSQRFAALWVIGSVMPALFLKLASLMLPYAGVLAGAWLPLAALTVVWASRNPNAVVRFNLIIPIQAKWLGVLTVLLVLFAMGNGNPLIGVVACLHLAFAWAYASGRFPFLPYGRATIGASRVAHKADLMSPAYYDEVRRREQEREERDRLRRLFERSLIEDPEDRDSGTK